MTRDDAIPAAPNFYAAECGARDAFTVLATRYWAEGLTESSYRWMMDRARHWARVNGLTVDDVIEFFRPDAP